MKTVAVDLGFGWTKAFNGNGSAWRSPSLLGEIRPLFENDMRSDDIVLDDRYFVGDLALRHSEVRYSNTNENKAKAWITKEMLKVALGMVAPEESINIVSGLPVGYYFTQKDEFTSMLKDFDVKPYKLTVGDREFKANPRINKIKLVPQPMGAVMDYLLDDTAQFKDKEEARKRILVIDIGFYTLDLLIIENMEINKASNSPPNLGIDTAYKLVQQYLKDKKGRSPARYELDKSLLSGEYEGYNIKPLFDKAFRVLGTQITSEIESMNMSFHRVILTGGAASYLNTYIDVPNKVILNDPQITNVRGYKKIGERVWKGK